MSDMVFLSLWPYPTALLFVMFLFCAFARLPLWFLTCIIHRIKRKSHRVKKKRTMNTKDHDPKNTALKFIKVYTIQITCTHLIENINGYYTISNQIPRCVKQMSCAKSPTSSCWQTAELHKIKIEQRVVFEEVTPSNSQMWYGASCGLLVSRNG